MSELNRLKRIEAVVINIEKFIASTVDPNYEIREILNDLQEALKTKIDWGSICLGATIKVRGGSIGFFIKNNTESIVYLDSDNNICTCEKSDCTVEPPSKYTELVKHGWPEDGKMPEWLNNNDKILVSKIISTQNNYIFKASDIFWPDNREWFVAIKS